MTNKPISVTAAIMVAILIIFPPNPSRAAQSDLRAYSFEQSFTFDLASYTASGRRDVTIDTGDLENLVEIEVTSSVLPARRDGDAGPCDFMVNFYDGGRSDDFLLTSICNGELPKFTSTGRKILLNFDFDGTASPSRTYKVDFKYTAVERIQEKDVYSFSTETYHTPSFGHNGGHQVPSQQPKNTAKFRRQLLIEATLDSYTVDFSVTDSDMPGRSPAGSCDTASLTFYNGDLKYNDVIATVCGEETPDFKSSASRVTVVFEAPITAERKYQGVTFNYKADDNYEVWTINVGLIVGICSGLGSLGLVVSLIIIRYNVQRRRQMAQPTVVMPQPVGSSTAMNPGYPQYPVYPGSQHQGVQPIQAPLHAGFSMPQSDQPHQGQTPGIATNNLNNRDMPPAYNQVVQMPQSKP